MKTILVDAVDCFIIEKDESWQVFREMYELLESYSNKKIVLTGATEDKWELYGLNKIPYEFFTLRHNPEKTDPEYYKILLNKFSLSPEEVVYFEHNPEAVKSAQSVGINSFHYDESKQDLASLKNFLDSNL
jgi:HAD superfamily hydrolase (TIGR01509 family)